MEGNECGWKDALFEYMAIVSEIPAARLVNV